MGLFFESVFRGAFLLTETFPSSGILYGKGFDTEIPFGSPELLSIFVGCLIVFLWCSSLFRTVSGLFLSRVSVDRTSNVFFIRGQFGSSSTCRLRHGLRHSPTSRHLAPLSRLLGTQLRPLHLEQLGTFTGLVGSSSPTLDP